MASQIVKSLQIQTHFNFIPIPKNLKPFFQISPPNAYKLTKQQPFFSAPQIAPSHSSPPSSSTMEVKKISELEHDNKENIPPFSTSKKPGPNEEKGKCTLLKINRSRRPLRDVTDFYRAAAKSELSEFKVPSPLLVSHCSSNRKRKLVDDDAEQRSCSKILRREYR